MPSGGPKACSALITAAGTSSRMGTGKKKELELINGVPVLALAVQPFLTSGRIRNTVVTHPPGHRDAVAESLAGIDPGGTCVLVEGGESRQRSVYNGLLALEGLSQDYVLIHDGCRPWITATLIDRVLDGAISKDACIPVVPPIYALKRITSDGSIVDHLEKSDYACAQTPQGFAFRKLLFAIRAAIESGKTYPDDAHAYDAAVGPVSTVPGDPANAKITYGHDLP